MKLILGVFALMLIMLCAASARQDNNQSQRPAAQTQAVSEGEKLFDANCMRCHKPPEDLSPRAAKAVLRHMRVRANLSEKEEQAILQYISPR